MKKRFKKFLHYFGEWLVRISGIVFYVSLLTFLAYFVLENLKTGLISNYFDLDLLLALGVISGLIIVLFQEKPPLKRRVSPLYLFSLVFAILTTLISYQILGQLEEKGIFLAAAVGLSIFIILNLFRTKYD